MDSAHQINHFRADSFLLNFSWWCHKKVPLKKKDKMINISLLTLIFINILFLGKNYD